MVINRAGKKHLVLNLRFLNQFILKDKFKYEDIKLALLMFQKEDVMFTFDLKLGYHDIYDIAAVAGKEAACAASKKFQDDLCPAGFVANVAKCRWEPNQKCSWLGFNLDLNSGQVSALHDKVESFFVHIKYAMSKDSATAKCIASITGKIVSMSLALGLVATLMTRSLYALLNSRQYSKFPFSWEAKSELQSGSVAWRLGIDRGYGMALQLSGWFTQMLATHGTEGTQSNTDAILHMVYGTLRRGQS